MHELALTENIVEIVAEEARNRGFARLRVVRGEIRAVSHVEPAALRFCFDAVARGAVGEDARRFVQMPSTFGEARIVDQLASERLPRICWT